MPAPAMQTVKLANSALSGIDGLVADVSSSVAAVKRDAGGSSKAAGLAIDSMVTRAIEKGQTVKETLAGGCIRCFLSSSSGFWPRVAPNSFTA
jgi:hypothetical protein